MAVVITQFSYPISADLADKDIYARFLESVVSPEDDDPAHFDSLEGTVQFGVMRCCQRIRGRRGYYLGPKLSMRISVERTLEGEVEVGVLLALPFFVALGICAVSFVSEKATPAGCLISAGGSVAYCIWLFTLARSQESFGRGLVASKGKKPNLAPEPTRFARGSS